MAFFSLFGFEESLRFNSAGARCAWVSAPWSSTTIELIEVPQLVLRSTARAGAGRPGTSGTEATLGLAHLSLDLTAVCTALPDFIELTQQRSQDRFGKRLAMLAQPHQQMMGRLVSEVAVVRAPDGVRLELLRRSTLLEDIKADW